MNESDQITVFIIDDDSSIRKALTLLLRSEGYEAESFDSAESFLNRPRYTGLGCIVLDIRMKEMSGLVLQEELVKRHVSLPVVFITGHGDIPTSVRVMKKGAFEFLTKPFHDEDFLKAVSEAIEHNVNNKGALIEMERIHEEMMTLTDRERDVLRFIIAGYMNKEISAKLHIAEQTVKIHRGHIMAKLNVDSVAELVRKSEKAGITPEKR